MTWEQFVVRAELLGFDVRMDKIIWFDYSIVGYVVNNSPYPMCLSYDAAARLALPREVHMTYAHFCEILPRYARCRSST